MNGSETINCNGNGSVRVSPWSIMADADSDGYGTAGTFYNGDAELIQDYLAKPEGELNIKGICHHINLRFSRGTFTLRVEFVTEVDVVKFSLKEARALIFALAMAEPTAPNPHRP